jgi:hypothetical protein
MATIFGECVSGGTRAPVRISQLGTAECMLALDRRAKLEGELELWIGAIGPFGITAARGNARTITARFNTPLEPAIINHFNA